MIDHPALHHMGYVCIQERRVTKLIFKEFTFYLCRKTKQTSSHRILNGLCLLTPSSVLSYLSTLSSIPCSFTHRTPRSKLPRSASHVVYRALIKFQKFYLMPQNTVLLYYCPSKTKLLAVITAIQPLSN